MKTFFLFLILALCCPEVFAAENSFHNDSSITNKRDEAYNAITKEFFGIKLPKEIISYDEVGFKLSLRGAKLKLKASELALKMNDLISGDEVESYKSKDPSYDLRFSIDVREDFKATIRPENFKVFGMDFSKCQGVVYSPDYKKWECQLTYTLSDKEARKLYDKYLKGFGDALNFQ